MKNNCLGSCAIGATFHLSENIESKRNNFIFSDKYFNIDL